MYKAVFLDLDGTLLDNEKRISEENINAIEKAKDKGVFVCICSGRQIDITRKFKEIAHASQYMICSNGAIIYDDDSHEELFSANIDKAFCKEVYEYVESNSLVARFDTKYGRYVNNDSLNVSTEIFQIILLTAVYGEMASVKTFYERAISGVQKNPLKVF